MEQITKIVQESGNSGHVYLPKEMVGRKVIVTLAEKSTAEIEDEILGLMRPHIKHILGIYIYGSYARGEETQESDIDILAITDGEVNIQKRVGEYEITSMTVEQLKKTLDYNALLILPAIKEAMPILNHKLIDDFRGQGLTKKNTKWYIESTKSSLVLAEDWIKDRDMVSMPNIVYPLVMRLRGMHMLLSLAGRSSYSNKIVDESLRKAGMNIDKVRQLNRMYREKRDDKSISHNSLTYEDIVRLYNCAESHYKKARLVWEKLR